MSIMKASSTYAGSLFWMLAAAAVLAAGSSGGVELRFMDTFSGEEREGPHVEARSHRLPHDFVDGQWQGIIAASDGRTYFSASSHHPEQNAQFYSYDPEHDRVEHVIDVGEWTEQPEPLGTVNTQGKIHSNIYEAGGMLYMATVFGTIPEGYTYKGGHFLAYDLGTGECINLGRYDSERGGLLTMLYEPVYRRLYAIDLRGQMMIYYDLETGDIVEVGRSELNPHQTRYLVSDERGIVYGSTWGGLIYRYDPETDIFSGLITPLPRDPEAPPVFGPTQPPALLYYDPDKGAMTTARGGNERRWDQWGPILFDEQTGWWYGVLNSQEYLFRFRPPEDRRSHIAKLEGLASVAFRPPEQRRGNVSYGLTQMGRRLYYVSYPVWAPQAHLVSYHIDEGVVTDHGPIVIEGGRRISEISALAAGSDGRLHGVAKVWSIEGEDPLPVHGPQRARAWIHCRFVVIDPQKDFMHAENARTW